MNSIVRYNDLRCVTNAIIESRYKNEKYRIYGHCLIAQQEGKGSWKH